MTQHEAPSSKPAQAAWYITTAIPYVNAPPHIGFALEMIQADVFARYRRTQGYAVRFQAGADENSLKNVQAAEAAGEGTAEFVAANAARFQDLATALNLSVDDFIRTSAEQRHLSGVDKFWSACAARGDIYKKAYTGLYCIGCEQFYKPAELVDGRCPEHKTRPEEISEENYFFRLSRYQDELLGLIASGEFKIEPASRRNEIVRWIEGGLDDFSVSRSSARARGWGIPVPGDPDQVIYVWFDALANYITALEFGSNGEDFSRYWLNAPAREHVIGKGITRFHAVYWPAMLLSAGLPLPTRILVHGYVTVEGDKIGKSAGNSIDPVPLAAQYGAEALRYYLLRHIRSTEDGDFSLERFQQAYQSELVGQLGNLANRTLSMIDRYCGGIIPIPDPGNVQLTPLANAALALPAAVSDYIESYSFHNALAEIWDFVALANKYVTVSEPWSLAKRAAETPASPDTQSAQAELRLCLWQLANCLAVTGRCLAPFLPATADRLLYQIGLDRRSVVPGNTLNFDGYTVRNDGVLFPKIET